MRTLALVAVGGNALLQAGQPATLAHQRANALATARQLARLVEHGFHLVVTHGNGPQVGAQLLRSELAAAQVSPEPLDVCDADTQGAIGYLLEQALETALAEAALPIPVTTVLTQTLVDEGDPAFLHPTKPIGPFYSAEEARRRSRELGWQLVEDAGRGFRRVVASPSPRGFVELSTIRELIGSGHIVIAAGGGGIPVVRRNNALLGVEAVIDKDLASALLASLVGARKLIISTSVDHVYWHFGAPEQQPIKRCGVAELLSAYLAGAFPPGSMGPKILAAINFLRCGGDEVIITSPGLLLDAVQGTAGTHIVPDHLLPAPLAA